jgi:hypothetical protein
LKNESRPAQANSPGGDASAGFQSFIELESLFIGENVKNQKEQEKQSPNRLVALRSAIVEVDFGRPKKREER